MNLKQYTVIKNKSDVLTADMIIEAIGDQIVPVLILWIGSEGRYCLLPEEAIQNLLELHEGLQQAKDPEYKTPTLQIVWSQGTEVDGRVGRILAGD